MRSLQRQLTIRLLAMVLLLATAIGTALYLYARSRLLAAFDRTLHARGAMAAGMVLRDEGKLELIASRTELISYLPGPQAAYFEIWQNDGTVFARSPSLAQQDLARPASPVEKAINLPLPDHRAGRAIVLQFSPRTDEDDPLARQPADRKAPPAPLPVMTVMVAQDREELDRTLRVMGLSLLLAGLALGAGTTLAVITTVYQGLRPLRRLSREVDQIQAASLHHRFSAAGLPRELLPICQRLNQLLSRLDEAFTRERRFTADVAHELRTPIAELRALAEVALKWPEDADQARNLQDTLAIAARMQNLVTTLLSIARCESGVQQVQFESVDLVMILRDSWKMHQGTAVERHVDINWELPGSANIQCDRVLLMSLLDNLFSNAASHTPGEGRIDCQLLATGSHFELTITNTCRGIVSSDLKHLFEPFWRKDAARSGSAHCGLGLSLVSSYAAALKWTVQAELPDPKTFRICVRIPRPQQSIGIERKFVKEASAEPVA